MTSLDVSIVIGLSIFGTYGLSILATITLLKVQNSCFVAIFALIADCDGCFRKLKRRVE